MSRYERNRLARQADNETRLMGETLAQFHARENPAPTKPGAGMPRVRCDRTPYLFGWGIVREPEEPAEYYDQPPEPPRQPALFADHLFTTKARRRGRKTT